MAAQLTDKQATTMALDLKDDSRPEAPVHAGALARRPYEPPRIRELGRVSAIILGSTGSGSDGITGKGGPGGGG